MRTVDELRADFDLYFREIEACLQQGRYWALLHLLLAMPDICASLENPAAFVGKRYVGWCRDNMSANPDVTPGDRYQMRNAVLHQGTTLPPNRANDPDERSQYQCFSFVDPQNFQGPIHQTVTGGPGGILNIDVADLAKDTRQAMEHWFGRLQSHPAKMSAVEKNLPSLARVKPKVASVTQRDAGGKVFTVEQRGITTSSS
jgi:hypothetical protein